MKKEFTITEFYLSGGCWIKEKPDKLKTLSEHLSESGNKLINYKDVLNSSLISLLDKKWWLFNSCKLTLKEKQILALESAKAVAYIYNNRYPNDNIINQCINITARYLKGLVSLDTLIRYRNNAHTAAENADDAAYAAAYATYAAANTHTAIDTNINYADFTAAYAADDAIQDAVNAVKDTAAANKLIKAWIKISETFKSIES